jgi:pyruvate dehydrogenase E2 component (dihydrolipoamide acetyltransferase)
MVTEIIMPKLGQTMEEGLLVEWFKKEGDPVERGDLLFTIESDKATLDVEATSRGFLRRILVPEESTVAVLTVVALMTRTEDEEIEDYEPRPAGERVSASPRARRTAREQGVDLALLTGTGPDGRIVEEDVTAFLESGSESISAETAQEDDRADIVIADTVPMTGLRGIIAERTTQSARSTVRVTLVTEVDATLFVEVRERLKAEVADDWGFAPGYNDLLGMIVVQALREFPYMNARLSADGQVIEHLHEINLGIAVDTERGLLVPVVHHADDKGLRAFGEELRTLVERALSGELLPDDLSGGTFTITNLGPYDVDAFTPVINPPEAAILGVGRIRPKPVAVEGKVTVRETWTLSLVFDHRLVDGAPAASFLQRIGQLIENPEPLPGAAQEGT